MSLNPNSERQTPMISPEEGAICEDCSQIDFENVFRLEPKELQEADSGILIADLGKRLVGTSSRSCALCRFLAITARGDPNRGLMLRAFSLFRFAPDIKYYDCPSRLRDRDQPYLAVVSDGIGGSAASSGSYHAGLTLCTGNFDPKRMIFRPRLIPSKVDFSLIDNLLSYCRFRHAKICGNDGTQFSSLKVIDCEILAVVPAPPSCSYVALSYVWGKGKQAEQAEQAAQWDHKNSSILRLECLSQTIQDAVEVTKRLGLRYLWVDRFCIDQSNSEEKHDQIQNMDAVYRGAEITIVAAAGSDEFYGLPGVGKRPRVSQWKTAVRDINIISTMPHPQESILHSVLSTRGWTFQEAMLSRRRLVFTDHQFYFECDGMHGYEGLEADLDALHEEGKSEALAMFRHGIFSLRRSPQYGASRGIAEEFTIDNSIDRYCLLSGDYTLRKLTFAEDSLNAFAGIARHLERSDTSILNLWGLPFPSPRPGLDILKYFIFALSWRHHDPPAVRRPAFPSWTWAGWGGEAHYRSPCTDYLDHTIHDVRFEFEPDCLVPPGEFFSQPVLQELRTRSPRGLHLDVMIASPDIFSISDDSPPAWRLAGKKTNDYFMWSVLLDPHDPIHILDHFKAQKWILVLVREHEGGQSESDYASVSFMVLEQHADFMTRVGMADFFGVNGGDIRLESLSRRWIRIL